MCTGSVQRSLNGLVDPFSTFHLLRTYNRLVRPVDLAQYYNISAIKDPVYDLPFTSTENKSTGHNLDILRHGGHINPQTRHQPSLPVDLDRSLTLSKSPNHNRTVTSTTCSSPQPSILLSPPPYALLSDESTSLFGTNKHSLATASLMQLSADVHSDTGGSSIGVDDVSSFQYFGGRRQRGEKRPIPNEQKDDKYFERRKRNNEAAKKSRDARKMREDRIAFRAAVLEQENAILRTQMLALRDEVTTLRQMMCSIPSARAQTIGELNHGIGSKT